MNIKHRLWDNINNNVSWRFTKKKRTKYHGDVKKIHDVIKRSLEHLANYSNLPVVFIRERGHGHILTFSNKLLISTSRSMTG